MMNNAQIQRRIESLRQNPGLLLGAVAGAGLIGVLVWRQSRRGAGVVSGDQMTKALESGDLDGVVREATRQGFEAGRATERAAAAEQGRGPLGLSPQEWIAFVGMVIPLAKQAMEYVRAQQQANAARTG